MKTTTFATLGPAGTNHELVTRRYIEFLGVKHFELRLVENFEEAIEAFQEGAIDYLIQCAVHPSTPKVMGSNFHKIFVVDTFISSSQDLAVLTRAEVANPRSISLVSPATDDYTDLSAWESLIPAVSIPIAYERMVKGEVDSALVYYSYYEKNPERFRVDAHIGSPDDAWIVYGTKRVAGKKFIGSANSSVLAQLEQSAQE